MSMFVGVVIKRNEAKLQPRRWAQLRNEDLRREDYYFQDARSRKSVERASRTKSLWDSPPSRSFFPLLFFFCNLYRQIRARGA